MKIVSINVQKNRHTKDVLDFLIKEAPDIVCLQEVFQEDIDLYEKELKMKGVYTHNIMFRIEDDTVHDQGCAILSRFPIISHYIIPYTNINDYWADREFSADRHSETESDRISIIKINDRKLLVADIAKDGAKYRIATTHFTWGYYGYVDKESKQFVFETDEEVLDFQVADTERLLKVIELLDEVVLCADLNAPRGRKVFDMLASVLKDNIPGEYKGSIDGRYHRHGALPLMVDTLFTTKHYEVRNVVLKDGLSDHMAVVGELEKTS